MTPPNRTYTPALGLRALTPLYDLAIRAFTREGRWRPSLVRRVAPDPDDCIVDVGCGTGTLTRALKRACTESKVTGVDPDPEVLGKAHARANEAKLHILYVEGFFSDDFVAEYGPYTKVVSSLVLHQVPLAGKREILEVARRALLSGGKIFIADYSLQRTAFMRFLFRYTVQRIDGFRDTEPNGQGILPSLMRDAGFHDVEEAEVIATPSGSISIFSGRAPAADARSNAGRMKDHSHD